MMQVFDIHNSTKRCSWISTQSHIDKICALRQNAACDIADMDKHRSSKYNVDDVDYA